MANNIGHEAGFQGSGVTDQKWSFKDYYALCKLSYRSSNWMRDPGEKYRIFRVLTDGDGGFVGLLVILIYYALYFSFYYYIVAGPFMVLFLLFLKGPLLAIRALFSLAVSVVILGCIIFDPQKAQNAIRYNKSAWYQNTGLRPSQVTADIGLYGEYAATMAEDNVLTQNNVYGKIYNNVVVPKRDGNFTEIDLVSVSEYGIHVIEAKARRGTIRGSIADDEWLQGNHTMKNPFKQNLGHINFLLEYLYDVLPEDSQARNYLIGIAKNTVLFARPDISLEVDFSNSPQTDFASVVGGTQQYSKFNDEKRGDTRCLNRQSVEQICGMMDQMTRYSPAEMQAMVEWRNNAYALGEFDRDIQYYAVEIAITQDDGTEYTEFRTCKDDGYYQLYNLDGRGWYSALPGVTIKRRTQSTGDEQAVHRYVRSLRRKS